MKTGIKETVIKEICLLVVKYQKDKVILFDSIF